MTSQNSNPVHQITRRIAAAQEQISDRVHASGDAFARTRGWTVSTGTGRLGFGTRTYRDPRFDIPLPERTVPDVGLALPSLMAAAAPSSDSRRERKPA